MVRAGLGSQERSYVAATAELAGELSSVALHERVASIARRLSAADHAMVVLLDDLGDVCDVATSGVEFERRAFDRGTLEKSVLRAALKGHEPVRASNLADDPALFSLPREHGPVAILGVPMALDGVVQGVLCLTRSEPDAAFSDGEGELLNAFATQAAVAIETARLRHREKSRAPLVDAMHEVSHALLGGASTDDVLRLVASWAIKLLGAKVASLVTSGVGQVGEVRIAVGELHESIEGVRFPLTGSVTSDVMRTGRPHVTDLSTDGRVRQPLVGRGFGPAVFVPLLVDGQAFGTLAVANELGGRSFSGDDVAVLEAFAAEAAVALEHGQIRNERARLALLEERERIAMELHDGVIQALFVVGLSLQAAEEMAGDPEQMHRAVSEAVESIDRTIRDLRDYIYGLQPDNLGDRHLERALREVCDGVERSGRASVSVDLDPRAARALAPRSPDVIQAAREALSNALRHAAAEHIALTFRRSGGEVILEVSDDGVGFDAASLSGNGRGLNNLESRAEAMGGMLNIESGPGRGTRVRIRVKVG